MVDKILPFHIVPTPYKEGAVQSLDKAKKNIISGETRAVLLFEFCPDGTWSHTPMGDISCTELVGYLERAKLYIIQRADEIHASESP